MKAKNRLAARWLSFLASAVPEDSPDDQIECMKQSFYAGAASTFGILFRASDLMGACEASAQIAAELDEEIELFFEEQRLMMVPDGPVQ